MGRSEFSNDLGKLPQKPRKTGLKERSALLTIANRCREPLYRPVARPVNLLEERTENHAVSAHDRRFKDFQRI
jgi:hypothetical protein